MYTCGIHIIGEAGLETLLGSDRKTRCTENILPVTQPPHSAQADRTIPVLSKYDYGNRSNLPLQTEGRADPLGLISRLARVRSSSLFDLGPNRFIDRLISANMQRLRDIGRQLLLPWYHICQLSRVARKLISCTVPQWDPLGAWEGMGTFMTVQMHERSCTEEGTPTTGKHRSS